MTHSSTDEEAGGRSNHAARSSSLEENESPIARRNFEDNLLIHGRDSSWYPRLLRGSSHRADSFPAGLEISAISVASLYNAHDEIGAMDR